MYRNYLYDKDKVFTILKDATPYINKSESLLELYRSLAEAFKGFKEVFESTTDEGLIQIELQKVTTRYIATEKALGRFRPKYAKVYRFRLLVRATFDSVYGNPPIIDYAKMLNEGYDYNSTINDVANGVISRNTLSDLRDFYKKSYHICFVDEIPKQYIEVFRNILESDNEYTKSS